LNIQDTNALNRVLYCR